MTDAQRTADPMLSALHEVEMKLLSIRDGVGAAIVRKSCEEIVKLLRERDQYKVKYEDTCQLVVRQTNDIWRLAGPREPPHCASCDCRSGS